VTPGNRTQQKWKAGKVEKLPWNLSSVLGFRLVNETTVQGPLLFLQSKRIAPNANDRFFVCRSRDTPHFVNEMFGKVKSALRPTYFPFTEPSAELRLYQHSSICGVEGCNVMWHARLGRNFRLWLVHPNVMEKKNWWY